jgi:hypothetical protein
LARCNVADADEAIAWMRSFAMSVGRDSAGLQMIPASRSRRRGLLTMGQGLHSGASLVMH